MLEIRIYRAPFFSDMQPTARTQHLPGRHALQQLRHFADEEKRVWRNDTFLKPIEFSFSFERARKYLEIGAERILYVDACAGMIPGYYCNYAEALFHTGEKVKIVLIFKR